jgi:putative oxidoreductase
MLRKLTATSATWAMLPLRLALGIIFIAHGAQKVFGTWEGPGLRAFINFPPPYSFMRPAWLWMGAAAVAELLGGILVLLGLFTRVGASLIACVMLTAMLGVHWDKGFFMSSMGIEFTLALLGMALTLLIAGGGQASVDKMISRR